MQIETLTIYGTSQDVRFYEMNNDDWGAIFKRGYWDKVKGDKIQFQSIANVLVSWAWGSGSRTAIIPQEGCKAKKQVFFGFIGAKVAVEGVR